jgi:hypothetical protein
MQSRANLPAELRACARQAGPQSRKGNAKGILKAAVRAVQYAWVGFADCKMVDASREARPACRAKACAWQGGSQECNLMQSGAEAQRIFECLPIRIVWI